MTIRMDGRVVWFAGFSFALLACHDAPQAGEKAFYQGKPASYWREKIRSDDKIRIRPGPACGARDPAAIPLLLHLLSDPDESGRAHVARSLSTMSRAQLDGVVPTLVPALQDSCCLVRCDISLALAKVDPAKHHTIPLLTAALADKEVCVRIYAAEALALVEPKAKTATAALVRALDDKDSGVRLQAAVALSKIDRRVDLAVPVLIQGLKDQNETWRRWAARALKEMGPDAKDAVNALTQALDDEDLMFSAAEALGAIGPPARPALPRLLQIVIRRNTERKPFWWARDAIMKIDPQAVLPAGVREER